MRAPATALALLLGALGADAARADATLEGHWRRWDEPSRGERFVARTSSLVYADSFFLVYFDARKDCAPFLALAFHPANPDPTLPDLIAGQHLELRVDQAAPVRFRSATAARTGEQLYFIHPLPGALLDAIAGGQRLLARSTLAPQIDVFSLRGSAVSLREQRTLCQARLRAASSG